MWRPEGWPAQNLEGVIDPESINASEAYEEGADAMYEPAYNKGKAEGKKELLEELRKQHYIMGESLRNTPGAPGWQGIYPKSKWYCIPDEEECV